MKVMQAVDGDLLTHKIFCPVKHGTVVEPDTETDTLKLVVLNRYQPAKPAVAFIRGFGLKCGALASSVAHDSHHIIAVGCDDNSILKAINHIVDIKG
jgi:adenine deaminase